ncbi:hypothetical protein A1O3_06964 [Capronia epimyces CBS 606.96]|uniref:ubiquitinyl hydrolase 1 n=1 Tax=Capronia epimyces CBS 606.96 TaxID=1182542 RepID=W9XTK8_9EURO|nr:uncharacterized protein A1O3_06964 [Capronia epimyces CBS 606.96]EXJ80680.1 hypothetical protein A1O3_06964 [Capronia epimyces CBS 606.96]
MVTSVKAVGDTSDLGGTINEWKLSRALKDLPQQGGTVLLHIRAQNAGIMISKVHGSIHIEAFELSPLNHPVLTTKGRLQRSFPGPALALTVDAFEQPDFQATVAHTLAKMSHQSAPDTQPKVGKAGRMHDENRDTTHPKIVTELFMGFLAPVGKPVEVPCVWKNTREEVMWHDALLPWRRSPLWLLLRVAMQLTFARWAGPGNPSADYYKTFILFLMGRVLQMSIPHGIHCDVLYAMNAKLGRRLLKLDASVPRSGLAVVRATMRKTTGHIGERWARVMQDASPRHDLTLLETLDFERDVWTTLDGLADFVSSLSVRENHTAVATFQPTSILVNHPASALPSPPGNSTEYTVYNLKAFEAWVACHLPQWLKHHIGDVTTCGRLHVLIKSYYQTASSRYVGNPESFSVLLLTTIELWIACDQSALHLCSLLKDYNPGVPPDVVQGLILPSKSQMQRLLYAEDYLERRRGTAGHPSPSIYRAYGQETCFAVRYFDQSLEHQQLRRVIETTAIQMRQTKIDELRCKKEEYASLMRRYDANTCDYYEVVVDYNDVPEQRHSAVCRRCLYKRQANNINIEIHEWPLPRNELDTKSTVFELHVPPYFAQWRDTTLFLLTGVLKARPPCADQPRARYTLSTYSGLSSFFVPPSSTQRLVLLSQAKPHGVTHRHSKTIPTITEQDICLDNGLRYRYYDKETSIFVEKYDVKDEILDSLTYQLPASSSSMQQFLFRPSGAPSGPSPNEVIASQSDCPEHISLDEYKALCTISLGYRIQWQNILLQLSAPSVDFRKVETGLMVLQSIHQVGPREDGGVFRSGHAVVADQTFATALLRSLDESFQRFRGNWESFQAVSTFISVAARLLFLITTEDIQFRCLAYLREIQAGTFNWVDRLTDKAYRASNDLHRAELLAHARKLALVCAGTFNVDDSFLDDVLASPEDGSVFIQCCILIHNMTPPAMEASDPLTPILYHRWKSLCYRSYPVLANQIVNVQRRCLDDAMGKTWSAYVAGGCWRTVSDEFDYWLVNALPLECGQKPMVVHYNLLTGELLVDGLPLARLPPNYRKHVTYRTLFGQSDLEVMPTTVTGLQFSGKRDHAGYTIHLGIRAITDELNLASSDLLVQAVKDGETYELVPSRVLQGELPLYFTESFVHWYNTRDDTVEFRPVDDPWTASPDHWKLVRDRGHDKWRMVKGGSSLISVKSETWKAIGEILAPLEELLHLHGVLQHSSSTLEVGLPRLMLSFFLKSRTSQLRSKQFRGLTIDPDQSLGTLVGLQSKLMLQDHATGRQLLIVPGGHASFQKRCDHVHVTIKYDGTNTTIKAHAYPIDAQLGRLLDNGTLQSKLWLCYLHALTSFCLPDPFMQRTGTEQALTILNSVAVRSFDRLSQETIELLHHIARLTAGRRYYPANERVMQEVEWTPELGFLAQHGGFFNSVQFIFGQAERDGVFYPGQYEKPPRLAHVEPDLLHRDSMRSSIFRVAGFGAEDHTIEWDAVYSGRDRDQESTQGFKAFVTSDFVFHERPTIHYPVPPGCRARLWHFFALKHPVLGPEAPIPPSELKYDAVLLQGWDNFVAKHWCALHRILTGAQPRFDKFRLMIWLSTLAFAKDSNTEVVQTLASLFVLPSMAQISPPAIASFQLSEGVAFCKGSLKPALNPAHLPFTQCPEWKVVRDSNASESSELGRHQHRQFQISQNRSLNQFIQALETQWPCEVPNSPNVAESHIYIDTGKAMELARPKFITWYNNRRFNQYLHEVGDALQGVMVASVEAPSSHSTYPGRARARARPFVSIDDLFTGFSPSIASYKSDFMTDDLLTCTNTSNTTPRLASLVNDLESRVSSSFENGYVEDLRRSLLSLRGRDKQYEVSLHGKHLKDILGNNLDRCKDRVQQIYATIWSAITHVDNDTGEQTFEQLRRKEKMAVADSTGQRPRVCPIFLLQQLSRHRWPKVPENWRRCLVRRVDLIKELRNPGHTNWDPAEYPESLLLEVESGFMIRDVQEDVARQMRNAAENATMQLNMGEGKSSVIVPIVAAALADGSRLLRLLTTKPQAKQMAQMLVSKLGGLLDRRVYHMPFSRSLRLQVADAVMIGQMCRECMVNGHVLLVQPEHVLSLRLMGLECLVTGKDAIGRSLLLTQEFFNTSSQDIVDESDESFSVKFELVYTMGMQRPIEFSPRRWTCIQDVLDRVKEYAPEVASEFPSAMEVYEGSPGSFPRTRILDNSGQRRLFTHVATWICENGLYGFPIASQPEPVRQAVLRYLTDSTLSADRIAQLESQLQGGFWINSTSQILFLLRGLLAGGILPFVFRQKRYRVQYGLDGSRRPRTKLAVPYRAKDSPTLRSEFSHPDVVIALTCLSHYYGGLEDDDLFLTFDHLFRSDQADAEYQEWVKDAPYLAESFRHLSGINLKDRSQCTKQVFPPLRHSKKTIDYFLTHLVFPKEMREFPHKLSASGWDIGQIKTYPTSGFSGTNDSRITLPLSVTPLDLQEQQHTNALVLEHLLRPENSILHIPAQAEVWSATERLLDMVTEMDPPPQVILDVGAQILDLSNLEVARGWLKRKQGHKQSQAVVFFDEDDDLSVLDCNGRIERLQTSPFADQLDVCLVYLDESHTRGTDLRLPEYYKAAVTLGANLTKDRLIQACMRMRKLGHGQSVVFCVSDEIKTQLLSSKKASGDTGISVSDVLCWAITETWSDIGRSMPLWTVQGRRFEHQQELWAEARIEGGLSLTQSHAEKFLEDESQILKDRYQPRTVIRATSSTPTEPNVNLRRITNRSLQFNCQEHDVASFQEEQERELSPEVVQEREVQRPPRTQPVQPYIHPDLTAFVKDGIISAGSKAFKPAFETLRQTSAATHTDVSQFPGDVLVTGDYASTVQDTGRCSLLDAYQRQVQWILTSMGTGSDNVVKHLVIISPYEAQMLQTDIRNSKKVMLHLYTPRPNLGIRPLDGLDLYVVSAVRELPILPPHHVTQLNLFAGQLYFKSFTEYVEVCTTLGLAWQKADDGCTIAADVFMIRDRSGQTRRASSFRESPVPFLRVLMTQIRRNCKEIDKTHMGAVLGGRLLGPSDFEDESSKDEGSEDESRKPAPESESESESGLKYESESESESKPESDFLSVNRSLSLSLSRSLHGSEEIDELPQMSNFSSKRR